MICLSLKFDVCYNTREEKIWEKKMMKKYLQTLSLILSMMFLAYPLSACGATQENEASNPNVSDFPLPEPEQPEETPSVKTEPEETEPEETQPEVTQPEEPSEPASPEIQSPTKPEEQEKPSPDPIEPLPKRAEYVKVLVDGLNIRSGAGTGYSSLGTVEKGVLLDYRGKTGSWYETVYRGKQAFVSASERYTQPFSLDLGSEKTEAVIAQGLQYLGVPYVYGATRYHDGKGNLLKGFTTSAFDCSSLQQYIFYKGAGTLLDVTTRTQILQGKTVKKSEIQRGDLLFFTNASRCSKSGIERVGHVALYLGENYILHTASDYAKIEQISTARWNYFIEARRV